VSDSNGLPQSERGEQQTSLEDFHADLDVFSGPLDLLLHLVKRDEIDVLDVSISHITDQYLQVLRAMQMFDVNIAADFLVMAATLMDIKARSLLPQTVVEGEEELDARDELVRQLLQYKRFREVSDRLSRMAAERQLKFARIPPPLPEEPQEVDLEALLEDVTIWDLVSAYAEIVRQIETRKPSHILYDEVPVQVYMDEVRRLLAASQGHVEFLELLSDDRSRLRVIGIFLALLELVRLHEIVLEQAEQDRTQMIISAAPPDARAPGPDASGGQCGSTQ